MCVSKGNSFLKLSNFIDLSSSSSQDPALITMATPLEFCGGHVRPSSCSNYRRTARIIREGSETLWQVCIWHVHLSLVAIFDCVLDDTDPSFIHNLSGTPVGEVPTIHSDLSQLKSSAGKKTQKSELLHLQSLTWHLWEYSIVHCVCVFLPSPVMSKTFIITRNKVVKCKIPDAIGLSNLVKHVTSSRFNLGSAYTICREANPVWSRCCLLCFFFVPTASVQVGLYGASIL